MLTVCIPWRVTWNLQHQNYFFCVASPYWLSSMLNEVYSLWNNNTTLSHTLYTVRETAWMFMSSKVPTWEQENLHISAVFWRTTSKIHWKVHWQISVQRDIVCELKYIFCKWTRKKNVLRFLYNHADSCKSLVNNFFTFSTYNSWHASNSEYNLHVILSVTQYNLHVI